ncbi:hypothetical protein COCOBI_05-5250 [Coccomyxa sp. Obi]|nr:hypothetical protein COCOBI_05-5250 [Coccomyxa sp. Obi]
MGDGWPVWKPRRHLGHLQSIEGRSIAVGAASELSTSACYFTIWQYTGEPALRWVYTSEQVCSGIAPQWARLQREYLSQVEDDSEQRHLSGLLHIHLYLISNRGTSKAEQLPPTYGPSHPIAGSSDRVSAAESGRQSQPSLLRQASGRHETSSSTRLHDSAHSSPIGSTAEGCHEDACSGTEATNHSSLPLDGVNGNSEPHRTMPASARAACCEDVPLPGRLLMSASLDLNALEPLAAVADLDSRVLPANTLLLELSDGLYIWPPSEHLLRTASGAVPGPAARGGNAAAPAVPSAQPPSAWDSPQALKTFSASRGSLQKSFKEAAPPETPDIRTDSRGQSRSVSRSNSASRLAEGPMEAARRLSSRGASISGSDEMQVALGDLEWSLMSVADAHRRLQAARARQRHLLKSLDEAVQRRSAARRQAAALQAVHDRSARQLDAAQRAQQAAAALQRGVAVSRQVAALQAQALLGAAAAMQEAGRRLQEAARLLEVEGRGSRLHHLQRQLVARRCRMAVALGRIYNVGPRTVTEPEPPPRGFLWDQLDDLWFTEFVLTKAPELPQPNEASDLEPPPSPALSDHGSYASSVSRFREVARLAVGGLELEPDVVRRAADPDGGWRVGGPEAERAAAALGYVARLVQRLASLLDVPLRYPLRFANSRSSVFSHPFPAGTVGERGGEGREGASRVFDLLQIGERSPDPDDASLAPKEFPLFLDSSERMRFRYAVFLLNKDIEQLLNVHGLHSTGVNQLLQNLYKLLAAAASAAPSSSSGRAPSM